MKILLAILLITTLPVFAQPLSDRTGLRTSFDVQVGGDSFVVDTVANFNIQEIRFDNGKIVMPIMSSVENNFGELQIPKNMTKGPLHAYLDGQEIKVKILQNDRISFVTLEFGGNGTHILEITSDYEVNEEQKEFIENPASSNQLITIISVIAIVLVAGAGSTLAVYFKRKKLA
ncbi:MAG TPA: hypothetical protein VNL34_04060 [Candidatus Nitrosotenuis sp.]|nr:hypothetical protein [Candidatus Nitrosotenuis sp.]